MARMTRTRATRDAATTIKKPVLATGEASSA
jgi:hypothetical protein